MAKETEKNNKGRKPATKSNTSKKTSTSKKTNTSKKVSTTSTAKKNNNRPSTVKKDIKVEVKKEVKVTPKEEKVIEEVKTPVVKNENIKKGNNGLYSYKDNTPFIISLCIIVILLAALIYSMCSKRVPKLKDGSEVVATIKGKDITANELFESLKETNGTNSLLNIIDEYIAKKEVKLKDADKEYADEVVKYYKDYAEYYKVDLKTFLANYLGLSNIETEEEFRNFVLEDYKKTLVVKNYLIDKAKEEDLKEYYNDNYSDKLTVKHILIEVDSENDDTDAADKEAKDKAKELIDKLNDTNKDDLDSKFEELVKDNSDDTQTYNNGGLMEDLIKSNIQESFWNAANDLKDGEYTKEPVKTTYGYHVILKVSSKTADKYEDVLDDVKSGYADQLLQNDSTLMTLTWDEIRNNYKLSIKDDNIKKIYENQIKAVKDSKSNETEE